MVETRRRVQLDDSCEEFIGLYLHEPRIQADTHSGPGRRGIVGQRSAGVYFFLTFTRREPYCIGGGQVKSTLLYWRVMSTAFAIMPVELNRFAVGISRLIHTSC